MPFHTHRCALVIAFCFLLVLPSAGAQKFVGNPMSRLDTSPPLTRSELRIIDSIIGLTPGQRELTAALYDDFFERYQTEAAAVETEVIALIDASVFASDGQALSRANELAERWNGEREEYRRELVTDLRLLLDQQQIELWPKVERELRRNELLPSGRLAGEHIDLISLVDAYDRDWGDDPAIVELLDRYAELMDRALVARQRALESEDAAEYPTLIKSEPLRAADIYLEVLDYRLRVRSVNTSILVPLLNALTEEQAESVSVAFYRQATEQLVPPSMTEARIRSAANLPTLTEDQKQRIRNALTQLDDRQQRWTRTFFEAVAEAEQTTLPPELAWAVARANAATDIDAKNTLESEGDELSALMAERLEMDRQTWSVISAILTAEQRADVPRPVQETVRFGTVRPRGL